MRAKINNTFQGRLNSNLPLANKSTAIFKKVKVATMPKNVENSRRKTVLNEKGSSGLIQLLKSGKNIGVFSAHFKNVSPNLFLKKFSSAKIMRS